MSATHATTTASAPVRDDGRHDFDFLHGRWQVRNERLRERLAGSDDWEIFPALQTCAPVLGGLGNVDAFLSDWSRAGAEDGFEGMTLRLFNPERRQWSIYWAGSHDGVLEPPVVGAYRDGVGTFEGELEHAGRPVRARFVWSGISAHTAHWHQQFSVDGGASWETNWHMWLRRCDDDGRLLHQDAVIELRRYRLHPGRRDELIELFEREFVESQEAVGMHLIGQFRDLDDPDRYTWIRGFPDHTVRRSALEGFYGGPTWKRHREAANATMLDSDDVLMLKPAWPGSSFAAARQARAAPGAADEAAQGRILAGVCALNQAGVAGFAATFEREFVPVLRAVGAELLGVYLSDDTPNKFPRLPVREDGPHLVWFARVGDAAAAARLQADPVWRARWAQAEREALREPPQWLRLAPTPRSELRA
ncbi:NIPSNAP family protein [Lysobacter firmicutimachus]|uniref:NIPSNAP family protein n=1 Tax=Lysobacter firmicutimachus TaxID=1792846 RepID=A0AAU8MZR0_9GAMM